MQGFIRRSIPLMLRRGLTMLPALLVLAIGLNPTRALVISQVVLSFGIPFALLPLVLLTRRRGHHGRAGQPQADHRRRALAAAMIIALNGFLVIRTIAGA